MTPVSRSSEVWLAVAALCLCCCQSVVVLAHGYKNKTIEIVHPWLLEAEAGSPPVAVSMKIRNKAKMDDRLVAVSSKAARGARIVVPPPGVSDTGLVVPAGGEIELTAAGPHVEIEGLARTLSAYDHLPLVLVFEKAGRMSIEAMVEERH